MTDPGDLLVETGVSPPPPLVVAELIVENVKRVEVVAIRPTGPIVEITGKNRQGKTSVLDALWWVFSGAAGIQSVPIRHGANQALIRCDLGDFIVTRKFRNTEAGVTTSVHVSTPEGAEYRQPQRLLDSFFHALSLDPLAFVRSDAKTRFSMLRPFVSDIDFDQIETERQKLYAERREQNAEAKRQHVLADKLVVINEEQLPAEPIDETALTAELQEAGQHNTTIEARRGRREAVAAEITSTLEHAADIDQAIQRLRDQIDAMTAEATRCREKAAELQGKLDDAPPLPDPIDTAALRDRLNQARRVNTIIDVRRQRDAARTAAEGAQNAAEALTKQIADLDLVTRQRIAAAAMPITGLTLTPEGQVLLAGVPFEQASDAEQLRASIEIAIAMNPRLRVLRVRDGSLLDDDGMHLLCQLAAERQCQVWIERVATDTGFELVAGRLRERQAAE